MPTQLLNPARTAYPLSGSSVKLVFAGTPEAALPSLDSLVRSHHEVVAVLTQPPAPTGRGRALAPSAVQRYAQDAGIPVLSPVSVHEAAEELAALAPDCIPIVAYGQIIPTDMLGIPPHGWVNLHFSLLPMYRGAAPVQHALWSGEQITGATTFILDSGMDTGNILGTVTEVIRPRDTAGELLARLADAGSVLLTQSLDALGVGKLQPQLQGSDDISYAPKITKTDARIDWTKPARDIDRRVRAMTPVPGAWTTYTVPGEDPIRLGVGAVTLTTEAPVTEAPMVPGSLLIERARVLVGTGSQPVQLEVVTPQGRRSMLAADWARGLTTTSGRLE